MINNEVVNREKFGKQDTGALERIELIGGKKKAVRAFFAFDQADKKFEVRQDLLPLSPAERTAFIEKLDIASANSNQPADLEEIIVYARQQRDAMQEDFEKNGKQFVNKNFPELDEVQQLAMQEHLGSNSMDHFDDVQMAGLSTAWNKTDTPQEKGEFLRGLEQASRESGRPLEEIFEQLIKSNVLPPNYAAGIHYIKDSEAFETFITSMSVGADDLSANALTASPVFSRLLQRDAIRKEFDQYIRAYTADPRRSSTQLISLMQVAERMAMVHVGDLSSMEEAAQKVADPILNQLHFQTINGQIIMFPKEIIVPSADPNKTAEKLSINASAVKSFLMAEGNFAMNNADLLQIPDAITEKFEAEISAGIDISFPFLPLSGQLLQVVGQLRGQEVTPKEIAKQMHQEYRWTIQENGKTAALKDSAGNALLWKIPETKGPDGIITKGQPEAVEVPILEASEKGALLVGKELVSTGNIFDIIIAEGRGVLTTQKVADQMKEAIRIGGDEGVNRLEGLKKFVRGARKDFTESSRKRTLVKLSRAVSKLKKLEKDKK